MNLNRDALITIRERSGHTKASLAEAAHISPATLTRLENGERHPSPTVLRQLAAALGCPLHALLGPEEEAS